MSQRLSLKDILHVTVCSAHPNPITFLITCTSWLLKVPGFIWDFTFLALDIPGPVTCNQDLAQGSRAAP